ncbi:MAG: nucleotidyltransferase domain-containing protein [Actinobacteria bacterium]|nr:nucleotidyltransferase domain-containing protein [Actinomycetota bacterium]
MEQRLAATLDRNVDLVVLNRAPLWLQFRILGEGQVVFSRDEVARVTFRARVEKELLEAFVRDPRNYGSAERLAVDDRDDVAQGLPQPRTYAEIFTVLGPPRDTSCCR